MSNLPLIAAVIYQQEDVLPFSSFCCLVCYNPHMNQTDLFADVYDRIKKKRVVLFTRDSTCLQGFVSELEKLDHKTLVLWALDCGLVPVTRLEHLLPGERRPRICLQVCDQWASGEIKMPEAKKAILASHAIAKTHGDPEIKALAHAVGHAGASVHVGTHAFGLPAYELTAAVRRHRGISFEDDILHKISFYMEKLAYWKLSGMKEKRTWASFFS